MARRDRIKCLTAGIRARTSKHARLVMMVVGAVQSMAPPAYAANESHALVELRYEREQGTESCPSEPDLRAAVAARLGYDPFVSKDGPDTVIVRVRRKGLRLEGSIERVGRSQQQRGRPTIIASNATDCVELGSSLAVALAIAVDPLSLTREEPPNRSHAEPAPQPEVVVAPLPSEPPREPPPRSPEPATPTQLLVAVGPAVSTGALPAPSFGVRANVGVSRGMFEVAVEGRFDPPVSVRDRVGAVEASLVLATLVPCFRYRFALACAQASMGALRGTGLGFDHTREGNTFYAAAGARLGFELALSRHLAARAAFEGQVPLRPTRLEADNAPVWSTPAFAFSFAPMLVGRFP